MTLLTGLADGVGHPPPTTILEAEMAEMVRPNDDGDRELRRVWGDLLLGGAEILLLTAVWTLILVVPLTYTAW
ncbi:MAG TPA: hypothetical protein VMS84_17090 [Mycobacterium sp.]|nr:hypothetical protein [Mycobacterium sp.]